MGFRVENEFILYVIGILFAWFALGILFTEFQKGELNIEFDSAFILNGWLILWLICVAISSVSLGLALKSKKT